MEWLKILEKNKNRIAIIVPYFGKLPKYVRSWINSVKFNPEFDFLFFTDDKTIKNYNLPLNLKLNIIPFDQFSDLFKEKFDFKISLSEPYKLCDYRPTYGYVLNDYLKGYEYWGFCDIDLVFGNLSNYISNDVLADNDRVYNLGHLSIFKNNFKMNTLFMKKVSYKDCLSYKYVFTHNFGFYFDETGVYKYGYGQGTVAQRLPDVRIYLDQQSADVKPEQYFMELFDTNEKIDYFEFDNGKVFSIKNGERKKQYSYVHFQKRNLEVDNNLKENHFYIGPRNITSNKKKIIASLKKSNKAKFEKDKRKRLIKSKKKKFLQGAIYYRLRMILHRI